MPGRPRRRSRTSSSTEGVHAPIRLRNGSGDQRKPISGPVPLCDPPARIRRIPRGRPLDCRNRGYPSRDGTTPCAQEGPLTPEEKGKQGMDIPLRTHATTQDRPAPLRYSRTWGTGVSSIAEARDAVAALLARVRPALGRRPVQDAQIVVSELVTNAAQHAPGPCALRLELLPGASALRAHRDGHLPGAAPAASSRPPAGRRPRPASRGDALPGAGGDLAVPGQAGLGHRAARPRCGRLNRPAGRLRPAPGEPGAARPVSRTKRPDPLRARGAEHSCQARSRALSVRDRTPTMSVRAVAVPAAAAGGRSWARRTAWVTAPRTAATPCTVRSRTSPVPPATRTHRHGWASSPTRPCASAARPARWPARSGTRSRRTVSR